MAKTTGALKGSRARSQSFSKAGLAAILSLNFGERELAAMTHRVISPVDRAERFRIAGETRVDVGLMGFLKINRGGLGISPAHAQRAAQRAAQPVIDYSERHARHREAAQQAQRAAQPAQRAARPAQRGGTARAASGTSGTTGGDTAGAAGGRNGRNGKLWVNK